MKLMFLEALQAYYAPVVLLLFFSIILVTDQLLTRQEKNLFLMELGVVGLMLFPPGWIAVSAPLRQENGGACVF